MATTTTAPVMIPTIIPTTVPLPVPVPATTTAPIAPVRQVSVPRPPSLDDKKIDSKFKGAEIAPVISELQRVYREKILPLENMYKFGEFASPALTNTDFEAKPMVLLLGQYSTGKTSFIRYMVERDYPNIRIGPEPTTDRFVAVMHGRTERVIPGNALAAQADKPFTALARFGMAFLNKLECVEVNSPILDKISFIDTPGVLSGQKQRIGRAYDFPNVTEWFAERADRILLLFDANKLDISDEFKEVIESLKGHDDKIRVVLNKADSVDSQQLMRVYGALMWSLGKVTKTPEVLRVYIGSFWDQPLKNQEAAKLLQAEQRDLLADLRALPRNSAIRKINELVKRARMVKVHSLIMHCLIKQFGWFGKDTTKKKILSNMTEEFKAVMQQYNLPAGDFPNPAKFAEKLKDLDISAMPKLDKKKTLIAKIDEALGVDIPNLMRQLPGYESEAGATGDTKMDPHFNPFAPDPDRAPLDGGWVIDFGTKTKYDNEFHSLTSDGKISATRGRDLLMTSGLPVATLREIWDRSDMDKDGHLDVDEYCVAMYLIEQLKSKALASVPSPLPPNFIPPSKRYLFSTEE